MPPTHVFMSWPPPKVDIPKRPSILLKARFRAGFFIFTVHRPRITKVPTFLGSFLAYAACLSSNRSVAFPLRICTAFPAWSRFVYSAHARVYWRRLTVSTSASNT